MKQKLLFPIFVLLAGIFLAFSVRGNIGDPIYYQKEHDSRVGGPFESTNSTARYGLIEAIVLNHTFFYTPEQAQFASPDVSVYRGNYFSLFTPGVSFIGIPFYALGQIIGLPQLTTYMSVFLAALLNTYLVYRLAKKLGGNTWASLFASLSFLFATNALSYAGTLTQHHMSTAVILIGLLCAVGKKNIWNTIGFGAAFGIGALLDIPNALLMIPIGLYMLCSYIQIKALQNKIKVSINAALMGLLIGVIPFVMLFGFYNYETSGSVTLLAQSIGRPQGLDTAPDLKSIKKPAVKPVAPSSSFKLPFDTRLQMGGFYTLLLSDERAWLFYSPIVFLGVLGLILAFKKENSRVPAVLVTSVVLLNIALYSMFGDPWGGWSFGPRYLIPSAALLSAGIGIALTRYNKNYFIIPLVLLVFAYSTVISSVGALTTNAIPPKVEALNLNVPIPYTYEYNFQMLDRNQLSALIYNLYLSGSVTASMYTFVYSAVIIIFGGVLLTFNYLAKGGKKHDN